MTKAGEQVNERITPAPRLVIALGGPGNASEAGRVEAPGRLLRMWSVLSATDRELRWPTLPSAVLPRLQRSLQAVRTELERSVSAPLAEELRRLVPPQPDSPSGEELRIECASLLGWAGGLVLGVLEQLEAAAVATALAVASAEQLGNSLPAADPAG